MDQTPQDAPACPLRRMLALRRMLSVRVVVTIILLAVLARLVAAPLMERARAAAHPTRSLSNLKEICLGIEMYNSAHSNEGPADLEALVENGFLPDAKVLVDPADKAPVLGRNGYRLSYQYPGTWPSSITDTPPDFIIVYSRKGVHPDGRIVLHVDGVVSFLSEEDLHKDGGGRGNSLKQQYDWLMEHHGADFTDEQKAVFRKFYDVDAAAATAPQAAAPAQADARVTRARSDIAALQTALDTFEVDMGRYPTTEEGLMALLTQPAGMKDWKGPYIKGPVPLDPWGHPYVYKCPGAHSTNGYDLHSFGPDGQDGGGDDIDNWSVK